MALPQRPLFERYRRHNNDIERWLMHIYRGWTMVAIAVFIYTIVLGSTVNSFGLFVIPVAAEFELSRASMNTAMILISLGICFQAPFIGYFLDRFPLRLIMAISLIMLGTGLMVLGLSKSIWVSAAVLMLALPLGIEGTTMLTMSVLVARWFSVQRARALTLSTTGLALGGVVMPPVMAWLIETFGWRGSLLIIAVALVGMLSFTLLVIRERPAEGEIEPGSRSLGDAIESFDTGSSPRPATTIELLKSPMFWVIGVVLSAVHVMSYTDMISLVPIGIGRGLTMMEATTLLSVTSAVGLLSKILLASFVDKWDRILLLVAALVLGIPLNVGLLCADTFGQFIMCAIALGVTLGTGPALFQVLQVEYFGVQSYGKVRGLMMPITALTLSSGMRFSGEVFDRTGTYDLMFHAFVVIHLVAALVICALKLGRPQKPLAVGG